MRKFQAVIFAVYVHAPFVQETSGSTRRTASLVPYTTFTFFSSATCSGWGTAG